ncbi:hypothetical protein T06_8625 [Trichinella sp. T6]|nr:hypothetical protein T06_8625 [Trichinella sp. T6]
MAISIVSKLLLFLTPEDGVVSLSADCSLDSNVMGCSVLRLLQKDDEGMPGQSAITSHGLIQSEFDSSSNFAAEMGSRSESEVLPDRIFTKCMQIPKALHFSIVRYKFTPITFLKSDEIAYRYATFICTFNAIVLRTYRFKMIFKLKSSTDSFTQFERQTYHLVTGVTGTASLLWNEKNLQILTQI